ncbi:unnamed protein product [Haemonchus placei]|uniref:DDE_3 domain-containing protein n=1 Tax=Haemonchus placei TaxID=6290 RepID=A0A0N4X189_HAEPC|nr:unnamed protein product [Haemonchus placei]
MDSDDFEKVLQWYLVAFLSRRRGPDYAFQQVSVANHVIRSTKDWFLSRNFEVLTWPARSPDLNLVENLWRIIVKKTYANDRQFQRIEELMQAALKTWNKIFEAFRDLSKMPCWLCDIGLQQGRLIDY